MSQSSTGPRPADKDSERSDSNRRDVLQLIMTELTVGPEVAGCALGLGRSSSYRACRNGEIPALRIGGKFVVPTAPLRRMLGIGPEAQQDLAPPITAVAPEKARAPAYRHRRRR